MDMNAINKDGRAGRKFGQITHNAKQCAVDGCENRSHARGLCTGHWNQWNKGQELRPLQAQHRSKDGVKYCPDCDQHLPVSEFHKKRGGYGHKCGSCYNIHLRMKTYGLSRDEVVAALLQPCEICGAPPVNPRQTHIDHDHVTGKVRGVLCHSCNTTLGHMGEDVDRIRALIAYIERHR